MLSKWVEFLQEYTFDLRHYSCMHNKPTDSLNCVIGSLHTMNMTAVGFNHLKDKYVTCLDIGTIFRDVQNGYHNDLVCNLK